MKTLPIPPLPRRAYSTRHVYEHVPTPHRASGSLCLMPRRLYQQVPKSHDDEQRGITFDGGWWCVCGARAVSLSLAQS